MVVKKLEHFKQINGLILLGGESTTIRNLIDRYNFFDPLKKFYNAEKPIFGICAGMVLVAKELVGIEESHPSNFWYYCKKK